jgi:LuxR family transcriptional regulator, maltose regulon positive regulatory protein
MAAKLRIPPIQPWVVPRPRVLEIFAEGVAGPLTLVSAPAGSGKTVLASCWAAANAESSRLAWISLDEEDGQPGLFWSYAIHQRISASWTTRFWCGSRHACGSSHSRSF